MFFLASALTVFAWKFDLVVKSFQDQRSAFGVELLAASWTASQFLVALVAHTVSFDALNDWWVHVFCAYNTLEVSKDFVVQGFQSFHC